VAAAVVATVMAAMAIEALGEAGAATSIDISASQARGFLAHGPNVRIFNCYL
jgi:hypothetical protein